MGQCFSASASNWTTTVTPNPDLPADLLDQIIDFLHGDTNTLKTCCLVSKSWIPRTRKHLFSCVDLYSPARLQAWTNMFPNPSISPACYTKYLLIAYHRNGFPLVDAEEGGWIPTFSHPKQLVTEIDPKISFVPFHGFSSMIKSRTLDYISHPCSPIFNLICSFPHLEDLSVGTLSESYRDDDLHDQLVATRPSSSPAFTGLLELSVAGGMYCIAYELLSLPGGLHFQKLNLVLRSEEDISSATALVEGCSSTLKHLRVNCDAYESPGSIDPPKATRLKDVVFACKLNPRLIAAALRTITRNHRNFKQLSICSPKTIGSANFIPIRPDLADIKRTVGEAGYLGWLELDRVLAQLHKSHSIRPKIILWGDRQRVGSCMEYLLPQAVVGGIVDLEDPTW